MESLQIGFDTWNTPGNQPIFQILINLINYGKNSYTFNKHLQNFLVANQHIGKVRNKYIDKISIKI